MFRTLLVSVLALTAGSAAAQTPVYDTARWLAGLQLDASAPVSQVQAETNAAWDRLRVTRLAPMKAFAETHFPVERAHCDTLFYPFGGPDIINALSFFPSCRRYILFGLEHVGDLPHLERMSAQQKELMLADMHKAQQYILRRNYFVTQYMSSELNTPNLNGVLPMVSATLVRMGYVILDVETANLDGSSPVAAGTRPRAVHVHFQAADGGPIQELVFASFDASDEGLAKNPAFLTFMQPIQPTVTLMKAASYLLHDDSFGRMRELVEKKTSLLVQDDTGLPYAKLLADGFTVELYGNYVDTIPVFHYRYQKDLAGAYRAQPAHTALPFAWSYARRREEAALQVARKRPPATASST
jgi:hypothetical protein